LLKRAVVKSYYSSNPKAVLARIVLAAIVCVPICIIGTVYAKAGARTKAAITEFDNSKPAPEQSGEWQTVRMRVTAYCPCPKCCGKYSGGPTACGHKILPGDAFVAADKKYDFGTEMLIAGYNNGEPVKVLDRGGAIYGDRLDVFFNSHEEALEWGVKYIDVKVHRVPQTQ
jgi:3D (Asp-Asp-Asp) domain-containing protein